MAKNNREKLKFLEILEETPLVNYACKKSGIGRTTVYRWMKEDEIFKVQVNDAIANGRSAWIDLAESALLKNVKDGKMDAIKFFLRHNDKRYLAVRSIYMEPLAKEERERYEELVRQNKPLSPERLAEIRRAFENFMTPRNKNEPDHDYTDNGDDEIDNSDELADD
jgi:hypothetical protein